MTTDWSTAVIADCFVVPMCCGNFLTKINEHRSPFMCAIILHIAVISKSKVKKFKMHPQIKAVRQNPRV